MLRALPLAFFSLIALMPATAQEAEPPAAPAEAAENALEAADIAAAVTEAVVEAVEQVEAVEKVEAVAETAADAVMVDVETPGLIGVQAAEDAVVEGVSPPALTDAQALATLTNADPADVEEAAPVEAIAAAVDVAEGAVEPVIASASDDLNAAALSALKAPPAPAEAPADVAPAVEAAVAVEAAPAAEVVPAAAPVVQKVQVERRVVRTEGDEETTQETVTLTAPDGTVTVLEGVAAKAAMDAANMKSPGDVGGKDAVRVEVRLHKGDDAAGKVDIQASGANVTQTESEDGKTRVIVISGADENAVRITIARD